ncbi:glycosyltransferase [Candidatus Roseilinea sp. NK_OTU-006]|jgi:glycosyltransferase involved in cell wall biosynthesis|uniref:glycosyltransferase n=1 Tax=Candidatus Roseilinea sp. NK_OTU-006 TaxID=2704250 RepID=UPI00145FC08A|nr:glycosyltransferase [Candidatus Roseilinea sp. NK_OTU-006]
MSFNLALVGTRGVPASYSGFETCAENLGVRLVQRGHRVTVYNRAHHIHFAEPTYKGMRLVRVRGVATKHLDTITHTALSMAHALTQSYDAMIVFIAGNAPLCLIPRLFSRTRVILNVDGLDWKRRKWGWLARVYIRASERVATKAAHVVVTDSRRVQDYYRREYDAETVFIPYGADVLPKPPGDVLRRFGLTPGQYVLFVGRLVPENCAHHLVDAWLQLHNTQHAVRDMKCVITGDAPYAADYIASLKARAQRNPSIVFTGYQFGEAYAELASNAAIFVETSEVGGTHPALVEAMAFGNCVIVNDTAENLETIGDAGFSYSGERGSVALAEVLVHLLSRPDTIAEYRRRARLHAQMCYSWDRVTDQYEALLRPASRRASLP